MREDRVITVTHRGCVTLRAQTTHKQIVCHCPSHDLKAVIDKNSGLEFSIFAGGTMQDADGPSRANAVERGNNIFTVSEADAALWRETAAPVYDAWIADVAGRGIDGQAMIDEAKALMEAYGG